jgi:Putative gypsy type transposon
LSSSESSSSDSEENVEKPTTSALVAIRVQGKRKKIAKIYEPRDAPTDSEEEVPVKSKATEMKKIHQKLTIIAKEGYSLDKFFPTTSLIVPRVQILDNQEWADDFAQVLVHFERRDGVHKVIAPDISDQAHNSFKGMSIYWKMPKYGFRLPLSKFVKDLLRAWDITPSQLMSTSWCVLVSFEIMFHEFQEILGMDQPTLPVFDHYFNLAIANHDYLSIKCRQGGLEIFNSNNPRISRINA